MYYFYNIAHLPKDKKNLEVINEAATRLNYKLNNLDVNSLNISDYIKWYVGQHLEHLHGALRLFSYILSWSVSNIDVQLDRFIFIDYGGGWGILSMLAKEAGIGTVIYNDIYDVSCNDAKTIAQAIQNEADHYVHGDIDDLLKFVEDNSIQCNAIASNDVIEHVYDIESFLITLSQLSIAPFNVVMASDANAHNPLLRKKLMQRQLEMEYKNREKSWGHKERDSLKGYFDIRKKIIADHAPQLSEIEIKKVAKVSRGLFEQDIKDCVGEYIRTKRIPKEPNHPTNTCDPYTGNWAEHLMDTNYLKNILTKEGFQVKFLSGYFGGVSSNSAKKYIGKMLNYFIFILKKNGLFLAPYYVLYARKQ